MGDKNPKKQKKPKKVDKKSSSPATATPASKPK